MFRTQRLPLYLVETMGNVNTSSELDVACGPPKEKEQKCTDWLKRIPLKFATDRGGWKPLLPESLLKFSTNHGRLIPHYLDERIIPGCAFFGTNTFVSLESPRKTSSIMWGHGFLFARP